VTALLVAATAIAGLGTLAPTGAPFILAGTLWATAGIGVGFFYPTVYLRATTPGTGVDEEQIATAAISAEEFGGLLGGAVGGVLINSTHLEPPRFVGAYLFFGTALLIAALAAARSRPGKPRKDRVRRQGFRTSDTSARSSA
jgi:predicted MFS family arabinose efflux permease